VRLETGALRGAAFACVIALTGAARGDDGSVRCPSDADARCLIEAERFDEALALLGHDADPEHALLCAIALDHQGSLDGAEAELARAEAGLGERPEVAAGSSRSAVDPARARPRDGGAGCLPGRRRVGAGWFGLRSSH
jgi:hypothetical protein